MSNLQKKIARDLTVNQIFITTSIILSVIQIFLTDIRAENMIQILIIDGDC